MSNAQSHERFPCLDGYRALAVFAVLLTHVGYLTGHNRAGTYAAVSARLDIGVTLFFVLSGFLLYRPFVVAHLRGRRAPSTAGYLWRRLLRIGPAYWVVVTVAVVAVDRHLMGGPGSYAVEYAFGNVYRPGHLVPGLESSWSLAVEAAFYLALPVIAFSLRRPARRASRRHVKVELGALALVGLGGATFVAVVNSHLVTSPVARLWPPAFLLWFAAGMALAVVSAAREVCPDMWAGWDDLGTATWWLLTGAVLCFWLATTPLAGPRTVADGTGGAWPSATRQVLFVAAAVFLLIPGVVGRQDATAWHRFLRRRPVAYLGRISYGIFLWQLIVLNEVYDLGGFTKFTGDFWPVLTITVVVTVALAAASYHLLEQPVQRLRGRFDRRPVLVPVTEPAAA